MKRNMGLIYTIKFASKFIFHVLSVSTVCASTTSPGWMNFARSDNNTSIRVPYLNHLMKLEMLCPSQGDGERVNCCVLAYSSLRMNVENHSNFSEPGMMKISCYLRGWNSCLKAEMLNDLGAADFETEVHSTLIGTASNN